MTLRPPSPASRLPLGSRLRRWLRRAWLDRLPVAAWVSAWREDRRRRLAAARRPQMPRLLPAFDPYEDRSFLGPNLTVLLQVGLVGTGAAVFGELLHQAFTSADPLTGPVPPGTSPQAGAEAPGGDVTEVPTPPFGEGDVGDVGGSRGWFDDFTAPQVSDDLATQLTAFELTGSLGELGAPGQDVNDPASDPTPVAQGGGGLPPAEVGPPAGGTAPGMSAGDAAPAGSFTPSPLSGGSSSGGDAASFRPVGPQAGGATLGGAKLAPAISTPGQSGAPASNPDLGGFVGPVGAPPAAGTISKTYGSLPLKFEPNWGQSDPAVQYLSHSAGFAFFLTADGSATLALTRPGQNPASGILTQDVLRLSLDGANPSPRLVPEGQLPSYNNYFSGGVSPTSISNVPQYAELVEQDIYPGINLVWHAAPGGHQLEYDFVVSPGADPSAIKLHVEGATGLSTDAQGNLRIQTGSGTLVQSAPVLTQTGTISTAAPLPVVGGAALLPGGDVGFRVGAYDASKALTIDPVIQYGSYLGGSGDDKAFGVAADGSGNAYVAGTTTSTNFPTTTGVYQGTFGSGTDLFVTKLNPAGSASLYSTYISGASGNMLNLYGLAVDPAGNAYVTGVAGNSSFPVTPGAYQTTYLSSSTSFVTRLNATGDALLYSTYFGNGNTTAAAIAVDAEGAAYITGTTAPTWLGHAFPTASAFQPTSGASTTAFVTKFTPDGSALAYSSFLGGSGTDQGYGIAVDNAGSAYVTGAAGSMNFPTTPGAFKTSGGGVFVSKVSPSGSALAYSTFLGAGQGNAIALDAAGDAFVTGSTSSASFPTTSGAVQTALSGFSSDAFVTALNSAGSGLVYSTYLGGGSSDSGTGIGVGPDGSAVVTGTTTSGGGIMSGAPFPTAAGALQSGYGGLQDAFVTRLNPAGTALSYSSFLGGSASDAGTAAAVDLSGNGYVVGYTASTNFPTANPLQASSAGGADDAFVVKLSPGSLAPPALTTISFDSGVSNHDQLTSDQTLTISGTSLPSATVTLSRSDLGVIGSTSDPSGAWTFDYTGTTLAEGSYDFTATQSSGGATSAPTAPFLVVVDRTPPAVILSAPSSTSSLGPVVNVTAWDLNGLPDGTAVTIEAELSTESGFTGTLGGRSESNYASGTLTGGAARIVLPALPSAGSYQLAAEVTDRAGNLGASAISPLTVTSVSSWSTTGQALSADPLAGDSQDQLGDVQIAHPLDLDQNGGVSH